MATTKKSSTRKSTTKTAKRSAAKRPATRKAPAKKANTRVRVSKKQQPKSFRVSKERQSFMTFTPSIQTFYWIVLGVICVAFALWIAKLQSDINAIYDSIDASVTETQMLTPEEMEAVKKGKN